MLVAGVVVFCSITNGCCALSLALVAVLTVAGAIFTGLARSLCAHCVLTPVFPKCCRVLVEFGLLDMTIAFLPDSAPPTIMSLLNGRAVKAEVYTRYASRRVPTACLHHCRALAWQCPMCISPRVNMPLSFNMAL